MLRAADLVSSRVGPAPRSLCSFCDATQLRYMCAVQEGVVMMAGVCLWQFLQGGKCLAELELFLPFLERRWRRGLLSGQMCWEEE